MLKAIHETVGYSTPQGYSRMPAPVAEEIAMNTGGLRCGDIELDPCDFEEVEDDGR